MSGYRAASDGKEAQVSNTWQSNGVESNRISCRLPRGSVYTKESLSVYLSLLFALRLWWKTQDSHQSGQEVKIFKSIAFTKNLEEMLNSKQRTNTHSVALWQGRLSSGGENSIAFKALKASASRKVVRGLILIEACFPNLWRKFDSQDSLRQIDLRRGLKWKGQTHARLGEWRYQGQGHGSYEKVEDLKFVGQARQMRATGTDRFCFCFRRHWFFWLSLLGFGLFPFLLSWSVSMKPWYYLVCIQLYLIFVLMKFFLFSILYSNVLLLMANSFPTGPWKLGPRSGVIWMAVSLDLYLGKKWLKIFCHFRNATLIPSTLTWFEAFRGLFLCCVMLLAACLALGAALSGRLATVVSSKFIVFECFRCVVLLVSCDMWYGDIFWTERYYMASVASAKGC